MHEKTKQFLKNIDSISQNSMLFRRFYLNPENYLKNENDYKKLINNNSFIDFLIVCLKDNEFINKIKYDSTLLGTIILILENSKKNQDDYREVNDLLISLLNRENNGLENNKEEIYKNILEQDFDDEEYFLAKYNHQNKMVIKFIVCDNEFLDIIESFLIDKKLSNKILNNLVMILNTGINLHKLMNILELKENNEINDVVETIGTFKIKRFDLVKADRLKYILENKLKFQSLKLVRKK